MAVYPSVHSKTKIGVFEGGKCFNVIINETTCDDDVVTSHVPRRYFFVEPKVTAILKSEKGCNKRSHWGQHSDNGDHDALCNPWIIGKIRGHSKKSENWAVHLLIWCLFLLFYSNNMHKWWIKVWFLTCQMLVLSGKTNFDPFLKTWKFFTPKFPMKYSKNGQNFTTPRNT